MAAAEQNDAQEMLKPFYQRASEAELHRSFHAAAAYFLNPRFYYSLDFNANYEIKMGLYETIQRMCTSPILREKVDRQLDTFHNAEKIFGMYMAIQIRNKKQPALWWESFGSDCPESQQFAICIVNLTCSVAGCERNYSTFDQDRLARLEAALASKGDPENEELLKMVSELQSKLEDIKAEQVSEREKALKEMQQLVTENSKLQYRVTHLVRALKEADCTVASK